MGCEQRRGWDAMARIVYAITGLICLGVAGWFLFLVEAFNPFGFWGFLIAGVVNLIIAAGARAKDLFFHFLP